MFSSFFLRHFPKKTKKVYAGSTKICFNLQFLCNTIQNMITLNPRKQMSSLAYPILFVFWFDVWPGARTLSLRLRSQHTTY